MLIINPPINTGLAPKGQQNIAQGTALGKRHPSNLLALKGQQNIRRATP